MPFQGLTQKEAEEKLKTFGYNEVSEHVPAWWERLLKKFTGPIPIMIMTAAALSGFLKRWEDLTIILTLLFVNVGIDFVQEHKAVRVLEAMKKKIAHRAVVLRGGEFREIESRLLVPDDVVKLKIGSIVPADVKLLEGKYLQVDQSQLTGESLPVDKNVGDEVYSGAIVKSGEMIAQVEKTGKETFFGRSALLASKAQHEERSHFQRAVIRIGNFLIVFSFILAIILFVIAMFRHDPILETIRFILVLLIASIPVALPAVLSVTMAIGAFQIARRRAVVSDLTSVEELAGVDFLCADKTGTLTQNSMTIHSAIAYGDYTEEKLFLYATLASERENSDPIEEPIFEYRREHFNGKAFEKYSVDEFIPFDPSRKYTQATVSASGTDGSLVTIKGAAQVIIPMCHDERLKAQATKDVSRLAQEGFKTLVVAVRKKRERSLSLVGLIALYDPPRRGSKRIIEELHSGGIDVQMLTGDSKSIATYIAKELNVGPKILDMRELRTGDAFREYELLGEVVSEALYKKFRDTATAREIKHFGLSVAEEIRKQMENVHLEDGTVKRHESEIIQLIEKADGFAEVVPEDKYFIIDKLQKNGHIVAMTGDGVNDAPALKKADIGIAVSGATDAARAAADITLLTPGLEVIKHAVMTARATFEKMKAYAIFRIAETIRIILFLTLAIGIFNFYPVTAVMIVLLALLNDIPVMMIAYDNVAPEKKPVRWDMKEVLVVATVLGALGVVSSFLLFYYFEMRGFPLAMVQAMMFLKFDVAGQSTLYLTRAGRRHFWHRPFPSLKFLVPSIVVRIIATAIVVFGIFMEPISFGAAMGIWAYALAWWLVNDWVKVWTYKALDRYRASTNGNM